MHHYWQQTSLPVILEVAVLIGVIVFIGVRLAPDHTERNIELIFTLIIMGIVLFVLFAIVGLPLWLFLVWWNDWSFPGWALWPCGALTVTIWLLFSLLKPATRRDR